MSEQLGFLEPEIFSDPKFLRTIYALGSPNNIPVVFLYLARKPENVHTVDEFLNLVRQTYGGKKDSLNLNLVEISAKMHLVSVLSHVGVITRIRNPEVTYSGFDKFSIDKSVANFLKNHFLEMAQLYPLADFSFAIPGRGIGPNNPFPSNPTKDYFRIAQLVLRDPNFDSQKIIPIEDISGKITKNSERVGLNSLAHIGLIDPIRGRGIGKPTVAYRVTPEGIDTCKAISYITKWITAP